MFGFNIIPKIDRGVTAHYLRSWKVLTGPCDDIVPNDRTHNHPISQWPQHDSRHLPVLLIDKGESCATHADGCNNVCPGSNTHRGVLHHELLGCDEVDGHCDGVCQQAHVAQQHPVTLCCCVVLAADTTDHLQRLQEWVCDIGLTSMSLKVVLHEFKPF